MFLGMLLALAVQSTAQTQQDLLDVLKSVSVLPEVDPLYQSQMPGGDYLVLLRPGDRNTGQGTSYDNRAFYDLSDNDFRSFPKPVTIMNEGDASQYGLDPTFLTSVSVKMESDQANVMLTSRIQEGDAFYRGVFTLRREFNGWEVTGKNVQTR